MNRLIIFLVRKRLHLRKYEYFQFANQNSEAIYYFTETNVMKNWHGVLTPLNVSLNWLLDKDCKIRKLDSKGGVK